MTTPTTVVADASAEAEEQPLPSLVIAAIAVLVGSVLAAAFVPHAIDFEPTAFAPRVKALDAAAGLVIGAFFVDRLLTFIPPVVVREPPNERLADLGILRIIWGLIVATFFVLLTNLQAAHTLVADTGPISQEADRVIAVLAIASGTVGLSKILTALNPKPPTNGKLSADNKEGTEDDIERANEKATTVTPDSPEIAPPPPRIRAIGLACVAAALGLAWLIGHNSAGIELVGLDPDAPEPTLIVRFGLIVLAAGIVEQLLEYLVKFSPTGIFNKTNRPILSGAAAVILGVLAAGWLDLYLLHNVGFFGVSSVESLNQGLLESSSEARWFDTFATGLVIGSGTAAVHDLGARLRPAPVTAPASTGAD